MLRISAQGIEALEEGLLQYRCKIYFQEPEVYTTDDYLQGIGSINTALPSEGGYEVANTQVTLRNEQYYFSRKFARELPVKRLVEIYVVAGSEEILLFRGVVSAWALTATQLTLHITA